MFLLLTVISIDGVPFHESIVWCCEVHTILFINQLYYYNYGMNFIT